MTKIAIIVNGQEKEIPQDYTVQELIDLMEIKSKMFVVEKNNRIIDKKDYRAEKAEAGDTFEIVSFFGGG